jgi:hypothetical protein
MLRPGAYARSAPLEKEGMNARRELPVLWLWLAAGVAFSPSLAEIARQTVAIPRTITPIAAALMLALCALRDRSDEAPSPRIAVALLVLASAFELLGILGGAATLSRISVPLAILGISRLVGHPGWATALLSIWLVSIPVSLLAPLNTALEHGAARFIASVAGLLAPDASAVGPLVRAGGRMLDVQASDAGLHLAQLLALGGWYGAALRGAPLASVLRASALWALLALALQPLFLSLAALVLVTLGPAAARALLEFALPALVIVTMLALAERSFRRGWLPAER